LREAGLAIGRLPSGRVLEIGCGKAEILARICEFTGATGLGIDLPGSLAEEPSHLAADLGVRRKLTIRFIDASEYLAAASDRFDVVILCGASHAVGGFSQLPDVATKVLNPGGWLILGELAWRASPHESFLNRLGMRAEDLPRLPGMPEFLAVEGLNPILWREIPTEQFMEYEDRLLENGLAFARSRPHDPMAQEIERRAEEWHELMRTAGIEQFSFGWGVFRRA
jgi:SAM-dependent methyltransferase